MPAERPRTLALGRNRALFYRSIGSAMFAFGDVRFAPEGCFPGAVGLGAYVRWHRIDQVLMPNPYGNPKRLACYRRLRAEGVRTIVCDRGALPRSWFFDEGFLADSEAYAPVRWDRPLTEAEQGHVRAYIDRLRSSEDALEAQGPRRDPGSLRRSLGVGEEKLLFVPLQRPNDTAVRFFAGAVDGMLGFMTMVEEVARRLGDAWTVVVKQHPLEETTPAVYGPTIRIVPPVMHVHDLIEVSDACLTLTSGVGLLSLAFGTPTYHAGRSFYGQPGLSRHVPSAADAADKIAAAESVAPEPVERFLHHLLTKVYSFATAKTRVTRDHRGAFFRATDRIRFRKLRILGRDHAVAPVRALVLSPRLPWPTERGSEARLDAIVRSLIDAGAQVSLCAMTDPHLDRVRALISLRSHYPEAHRIELVSHPGRGVARAARELRRAIDLATGGVHEIANLETCPPAFRRAARQLCDETDPTHLLVSYAKLTPAVPEDFEGVKIVDTHDCQTHLVEESQRYAGTRRLVSLPRHRRSEQEALRRYDRIVAINPCEAHTFRKWAPDAEVFFIPHFTLAAPLPSITIEQAEHDAFFIGSGSSFNVLALRWLLEEILPRVRERAPHFRFAAVGAMTLDRRIPAGLAGRATMLGRVDDIERVYRKSRVAVAPIRAGGGMKTKVVEAFSFRRPVVCTSQAADGIAVEHGASAWIADDADGLADGLVALYEDPALWERIAEGGLALHARAHSPEAVAPRIGALLAAPADGKRGAS